MFWQARSRGGSLWCLSPGHYARDYQIPLHRGIQDWVYHISTMRTLSTSLRWAKARANFSRPNTWRTCSMSRARVVVLLGREERQVEVQEAGHELSVAFEHARLVDLGAACFAGPESSIEVVSKDEGALVAIDGKTRPRFHSNGKRSLFSGLSSKVFHAYGARPVPEESKVVSGFDWWVWASSMAVWIQWWVCSLCSTSTSTAFSNSSYNQQKYFLVMSPIYSLRVRAVIRDGPDIHVILDEEFYEESSAREDFGHVVSEELFDTNSGFSWWHMRHQHLQNHLPCFWVVEEKPYYSTEPWAHG